jgi:hypothetical protein
MRQLSFRLLTQSRTPIPQANSLLERATDFQFETFTPGGLFGTGSLFIPHNYRVRTPFGSGDLLRCYTGGKLVYEGHIDSHLITNDGSRLTLTGPWGYFLNRKYTQRRWADTRIDAQTWRYKEDASGADYATPDWYNRLAIFPKAVSWGNNTSALLYYTAPAGETVKRITFSYDFKEGAQQWVARVLSSADLVTFNVEDTISATATGTKDITLATAYKYIVLQFANISGGAQTPAADGTIGVEWTDVKVYSSLNSSDTPGTMNMDVLLRDTVANFSSDIILDSLFTVSNTFSLVPFIAQRGAETWAAALLRAASFGDSSLNEIQVRLRTAQDGGGVPSLLAAPFPDLSDWSYSVPFDLVRGGVRLAYDEIFNYIIVRYQDAQNGEAFVTPTDDATLTDATSVSDYGRREYVLSLDTSSAATATNLAKRFLAARKNPRVYLDGPISVQGKIQGRTEGWTEVIRVTAARRLRIANWLDDLAGTGLNLRINRTRYDARTDTLQIYAGQPDPLAVQLARLNDRR